MVHYMESIEGVTTPANIDGLFVVISLGREDGTILRYSDLDSVVSSKQPYNGYLDGGFYVEVKVLVV